GTPAPKDASTASWHALEEDLPKLKKCLHLLLFREATLAERIDQMLAAPRPRRYITEELAVPSMLLVFADEARHSGVNRMPIKERKLRQVRQLPPLSASASVGERFSAWDTTLRELPAKYGKSWNWPTTYAFWFSQTLDKYFGPEDVEGPEPETLEALAGALCLSDEGYLSTVRELLFENG